MPNTKSSDMADYQSRIIERIPATVPDAYRMILVETIENLVDNPGDPEDTTLRWRIQAAYHSNTEPQAHEVTAMALCFESGALEGELLDAQKRFYNTHLDLYQHLHEWTVRGLAHMRTVQNRRRNIATAAAVGEGSSSYATESTLLTGIKRKAPSDGDFLSNANPSKKSSTTPIDSLHVENENTPRLNQLARSQFRGLSEDLASPAAPDLKTTNFPKLSLLSDQVLTVDTPDSPRNNNTNHPASIAATMPAEYDTVTAPSLSHNETRKSKAELNARIDYLNTRAVDKLSHAETLRNEHSSLSDKRSLNEDPIEGLNSFVNASHNLSSRAMRYHDKAIRATGEATRLQADITNATMDELDKRISRLENVMVGLGHLARSLQNKS
ncbi:uncharacterized protein CTRU02_212991 [Colletotrichum truncatum]|uniref:Uncharacterized protein n=1 Tax=Colletotrichum truncatum TaxID=5467 RepID=A0ACC3YJJ2_COLTU|nr:uncharacterized protein CTRU02_03312 [Colletotrichum truncatum]KAF6797281.1 hypothetical protein CTRU02_03312 [Colletotrichum truncatum]